MFFSTGLSTLLLASGCSAIIYDTVKDLPHRDYDYIVVGGGVAGSVIANRLTEDRNTNVLLLEAGPSHKGIYEIMVPFYFFLGIPDRLSWNYTTVPQQHLNNRPVLYPRGHVLGGSSALNGMVYDRGSKDHYDKLARTVKDDRWSWDSMLPYFLKMEGLGPPADHHDTTGQVISTNHNTRGPLGVSLPGFSQQIDRMVLESFGNGEFPFTHDLSSGEEKGFGWQVSTIHNGTRTTAATAYLADKYLQRPNLDVLVNAMVSRVLPTGNKINKVEFHQGPLKPDIQVHATREVILSAGTVNTPHILLNSGIGDKNTLSSLKIPLVHDLPGVGKNLTDTVVMYISWEVNSSATFDTLLNNITARNEAFAEWNATRTGRMANGLINMSGFARMNRSKPEVQKIIKEFGDATAGPRAGDFALLFIDGGLSANAESKSFFSVTLNLISPMSRGSISLNPSDPRGPPLFDPAYMSSPYDMFVMRQAFEAALNFTDSEAWKSYLGAPANGLGPVIEAQKTNNSSVFEDFVRNNVQNAAHVVATSSMSAVGDSWGVVDPDLRVKGIQGLRIVDASVYPFVPAGYTQIPTYCLAERAADIIKGSH
ncbi:aryl-alcohol-oxidase from pleurotus Eryingii [Mycena rebaudengoi]|nr:aryl-alcohol-oxidase from pleurotus Eryingii [Mycena rebaudengoi]